MVPSKTTVWLGQAAVAWPKSSTIGAWGCAPMQDLRSTRRKPARAGQLARE